ncbi:MAG: pyruvate kinase [Clostridia bacterium]|nr:pyruvate kinase [Clostridia bacterium]MDD4386571.1 pyruvate kinase [Clostridia bacterium]
MRRTKIVATIGPASEKEEVFTKLIEAGVNIMRLNFSHGTHEEHLEKVMTLKKLNKKLGTSVAFLLDTKGPEIRLGTFVDDQKHMLIKGNKFTLTTDEIEGTDKIVSVTYEHLPKDVEVGGHILINDGLVNLIIDKIDGHNIECTVANSGLIGNRKGVNVPGAKLQLKAMTEKDKDDLKFAVDNDFDFVAASFVRKASDVIEIREYLKSLGNTEIKIISKIENQEGLDNFDKILKVTDGIMVARGDLGVEIPIEHLPSVQKNMIRKTVAAGKPVITATQMLESMQSNPRPTRAEVSDVANAVYDGTSAIMLSGESAQGEYPLECVQTMVKISEYSESNIDYWKRFKKKNLEKLTTTIDNIDVNDKYEFKKQANFAVCCSAMFSNADAIIAVSEHGETPSMLSSFKPACPIYVLTANLNTYRQMSLEHGVKAIYIPNEYNFDSILKIGIEKLKTLDILKDDDTVVLSGGFPQTSKADYLAGHATGCIIKI